MLVLSEKELAEVPVFVEKELTEVPVFAEKELVHKTGKTQLMISIIIKVDLILFFISFLVSWFCL